MAYDEDLAARVRERLASKRDVAEIKMFGGLCFTLKGNMVLGILGDELMVRIDPERQDAFLAEPGTRVMDMTKRPMRGIVLAGGDAIRTARGLSKWVDRALAFVEPMPAKQPKKKKPATGRAKKTPRA